MAKGNNQRGCQAQKPSIGNVKEIHVGITWENKGGGMGIKEVGAKGKYEGKWEGENPQL